jgi:hypothetical protein|tara:strand:- start:1161 stop:1691 length:531 start_codon:yes stop_codon:yes gene_type:complete
MSYLSCTAAVRTGSSSPIVDQYLGVDGVVYNVLNREIIVVPNNLQLSAGLTPYVQSTWLSGSGTIVGTGVVLDSLGNEYVRFYPSTLMTPAFSFGSPQVYYPPNPTTPLVSGDYTVLTFALTITDPDGRTKGTSQICIGGTEITPTPTPTFVPTLTPTPTPVPPTPTPTATPILYP